MHFIHSLSVGKVDQATRRKVINFAAGTFKGKPAQEFFIENNLIQRVDVIYTFIYLSFRCILKSRAVMKVSDKYYEESPWKHLPAY